MRREREEALASFLKAQMEAQVAFTQELFLADRIQTRKETLHTDIKKALWPKGQKDPDDVGTQTSDATEEMIQANMRLNTLMSNLDNHRRDVRLHETTYSTEEELRRQSIYSQAVNENNPSCVSKGWKIFSDICKDFGISLTVGQDDIDGFFVDVEFFPTLPAPGASS